MRKKLLIGFVGLVTIGFIGFGLRNHIPAFVFRYKDFRPLGPVYVISLDRTPERYAKV